MEILDAIHRFTQTLRSLWGKCKPIILANLDYTRLHGVNEFMIMKQYIPISHQTCAWRLTFDDLL